jgi:hypothetical protein
MKLKKYNNYLNEDKYEDEYFDEYGSQDDYEGQEDAQGDDDMEHLLYLLRTFLNAKPVILLRRRTVSTLFQLTFQSKRFWHLKTSKEVE